MFSNKYATFIKNEQIFPIPEKLAYLLLVAV